jgi:hypothetical protein
MSRKAFAFPLIPAQYSFIMKSKFAFTLLALALLLGSCAKDDPAPAAIAETDETPYYYTPSLDDLVTDIPSPGDGVTSRSGYWTTIPAGSTNALAQAISEADPGGILYLKAGTHTETARVTVNKPLKIIGEDGAVLRIASPDTSANLNPAVYVLNAPGTAIQNVELVPLGDGAVTAIAFENSPLSAVLKSKISGFPYGVLVEKSGQVALIGNVIKDAQYNAIFVNRGKSLYIADNEISHAGDIGVWAGDRWGTFERNHIHHNPTGVLLCNFNVIFGSVLPSSPDPIGAEVTCTGWKLRDNKFTDNELVGLSVRDGPNLNLIESSNEFSGNGTYDINIPADEDFPGILFIPTAKNNTIYATPGVLIKDCGINNTIIGGTLVDTTVDPCN